MVPNQRGRGWTIFPRPVDIEPPFAPFAGYPETYYRVDTAMMFQGAVHRSVLEALDGITSSARQHLLLPPAPARGCGRAGFVRRVERPPELDVVAHAVATG